MLSPQAAFVRLLTAFIAVVLLAAACGGDDDSSATAGADDATAAASDAADDNDDDNDDNNDDNDDGNGADGADDSSGSDADDEEAEAGAAPTPVPPPPGDGAADDLTTKPAIDDAWLGDAAELEIIDLVEGDGAEALPGSRLTMQYVGVLASDGSQFDASWDRGQPFQFQLQAGQVISGWDEGIEGMREGGRRVLRIPSAQAYGERDSGTIPANSDLVFVVDLLEAGAPPEPAPPVPEDALGPVEELETIDLVEGSGAPVERGDILVVQYVGVGAADGLEFDSTWSRGQQPFRLTAGMSQVIDGWNEGLDGMKAGGERILRIPAAMAYGDQDLVFRVHLEEVIPAPYAHTISFDGDAPTEVTVEVIEEGTGEGAAAGGEVELDIAMYVFSRAELVQSTWQNGSSEGMILLEGTMLPGLAEALEGIKVGETRRIELPTSVAFPNGEPTDAGFADPDALTFVVTRNA